MEGAFIVATGSNGASIYLGKRHSVTKLLKDEVPHLFAMCHSLNLSALDSKKDRYAGIFADLRSVLLNLHKQYQYSAKALIELKVMAEAMTEKMLKPVNLEGTGWMPHLSNCLDVLLRQYLVFVNHFENTVEGILGLLMFKAEQNLS